MDSGMHSARNPIYSLEERIEAGIIPDDGDLSIFQLIGIIDQLIACQVSEGAPKLSSQGNRCSGLVATHLDRRSSLASTCMT